MRTEIGVGAEAAPDGKGPADSRDTTTARPRKGRRMSKSQSSGGSVRYFLAKSEGTGASPSFDREFESESEVIVESLKTGKSYFVISEWKGLADLSRKVPLIRKEAVTHRKTGSGS
jgi:hypothetical protein